MEDFIDLVKALADENRLRVLAALGDREACVCEIIDFLGLAPSTVSRHMSILRRARLVKGRKQGRWMYYRLAGEQAPEAVRQALEWVDRSLSPNPKVAADRDRLQKIIDQRGGRCEKKSS